MHIGRSQFPTLSELLQYKNTAVIRRYEEDYTSNKLSGHEAFIELLKFLWVNQKHKHDLKNNPHDESLKFACGIYEEMQEIDDMWHTFLLFTKDYQSFCMQYFSEFIHHIPEEDNEENKQKVDQFTLEFGRYLSYIYDHLGEETVKKWFAEDLT